MSIPKNIFQTLGINHRAQPPPQIWRDQPQCCEQKKIKTRVIPVADHDGHRKEGRGRIQERATYSRVPVTIFCIFLTKIVF